MQVSAAFRMANCPGTLCRLSEGARRNDLPSGWHDPPPGVTVLASLPDLRSRSFPDHGGRRICGQMEPATTPPRPKKRTKKDDLRPACRSLDRFGAVQVSPRAMAPAAAGGVEWRQEGIGQPGHADIDQIWESGTASPLGPAARRRRFGDDSDGANPDGHLWHHGRAASGGKRLGRRCCSPHLPGQTAQRDQHLRPSSGGHHEQVEERSVSGSGRRSGPRRSAADFGLGDAKPGRQRKPERQPIAERERPSQPHAVR
jgi:hypothetical protein